MRPTQASLAFQALGASQPRNYFAQDMIDRSKVSDARVRLVLDAMDAILVRHNEREVGEMFHPDFVQHNPWAKDGAAHVKEMCAFEFGVEVARVVVQGDIVAYHGYYTAPNPLGDAPLLCVDLWRVQGDQIVEHWDALQPVPASAIDTFVAGPGNGEAVVSGSEVAKNAALVRQLLEGNADAGVFAESFTHHAAESMDAAAFLSWLGGRTIDIRRTVSSGDSVLAQVDTRGEKREVAYVWLRMDKQRVTDLWLVTQEFVAAGEAATAHPHF